MKTATRQDLYLVLIDKFVRRRLGRRRFEACFLEMWRQDRDGQWAEATAVHGDEVQRVQRQIMRHEITRDEFRERWGRIFPPPTSPDAVFADLIARVFTAVEGFVADPSLGIDPATEYDEAQLRAFVAEAARPFLDARRTEG